MAWREVGVEEVEASPRPTTAEAVLQVVRSSVASVVSRIPSV